MKKLSFLFGFIAFQMTITAQEIPSELLSHCIHDSSASQQSSYSISEFSLSEIDNCGNSSLYFSDNNLYIPTDEENTISIKMNFIFLTKEDGTGNFEENNPEHVQVIDDLISRCNNRLKSLINTNHPNCGNDANFLSDTKIQILVTKIWKVDHAWDYLVTGFRHGDNPINSPLYPPSSEYYYDYLNTDPTIPKGVNVVFANDGEIYEDLVVQKNYENYRDNLPTEKWAASQFPCTLDLARSSKQFYPDSFNKYFYMKEVITEKSDQPWSVVRNWYIASGNKTFPHELGHTLGLQHQNQCPSHVMNPSWHSFHNYFHPEEIGKMLRLASVSNVRQFFSVNSYHNTELSITNDQLWDLDFRIYKDVVIENNASLTTTCNLIVPPENKIIIRDGGKLTLNQGTLRSANNTAWEGIKIEGNGFLEILPGTDITPPFSAVTGYAYNSESTSIVNEFNTLNLDNYATATTKSIAVTVFPNPFKNKFTIEIEAAQLNSNLTLKNSNHVTVLNKVLTKEITEFDTAHMKKDIYYLSLWQTGTEIHSEFILKK